MRGEHKVIIRVFHEVTDLQKVVIKQIFKDIDFAYIKTMCNRNTSTIQADVQVVLAYLFTTYGMIEPEVSREHKLKGCEMVYDLMDTLVTSYNNIEELEYLSHATVNSCSVS